MRVVYVDTLFLFNILVDYFLLLLTAKVAGVYAKRSRLLAGAAAGALFAVLLYFPPMPVLLAALLRAVTGGLTVIAAFGFQKKWSWLRLCGVFLLLTLLLAGAVMGLAACNGGNFLQNGVPYIEISIPVMLISFIAIYLLSGLVLGKGRAEIHRSWREVTVSEGAHQVCFRALVDSGNLLRDPLSGQRVIVLQADLAANLFDETGAALLRNLSCGASEEFLPKLCRCCKKAFWLLPMHTAAENGMLLVFRPERLYIDGALSEEYLLGLTTQTMEIGGDCHALMGV